MKNERKLSAREAVIFIVAMLEVLFLVVPGMRNMQAQRRMNKTMRSMGDVANRLEDPSLPPPTAALDGWGTPLRVGRLPPIAPKTEPVVVLVSAGSDRIFEEPSLERAAAAPYAGTLHDDADIVWSGETWMRYPGS